MAKRGKKGRRKIPEGQCRKLKNGAYVCKCNGKPRFSKNPSCSR